MIRLREFIGGLVLAMSTSAVALAAETAEHQEEASGGMPQLDPSTFGSQIFWLVLTFGGLYYLMASKVLPAVEGVMAERNNRIQSDLDAAANLRAEAEAAYATYEKQLQDAAARAQEAVTGAKNAVGSQIAEQTSKLEAELDAQIEKAASEVTKSAASALKGIDDVASEVAAAAVERLIGVKVSKKEARAALAAVK